MAHIFSFLASKISRIEKKEFFLIVPILIIASFLRIFRIENYLVFLGDEGRDVLVVYNILHGNLTLLGPTSSVGGFFLGPIYYYFMAPFLWLFGYNPVGPAIMVAIFGVLTVLFIYIIGKEFFGAKAGIIAAALYAIAPFVILHSRSSWNPNVMPFFSLVTLYSLYKAFEKNKKSLFLLSGFLFGICMQLHYLATFLGVVIFVYILFSGVYLEKLKNIKSLVVNTLKRYVLFVIGFLIGFSPFILFEARHNFTNTLNILNFIVNSPDTGAGPGFSNTITDVLFRIFGSLIVAFPPISKISLFGPNVIGVWGIFVWVLVFVSIFFLIKDFKKSILKNSLLACWLLFGVLLFGFYKKPIYEYYFVFIFALPFLLVGNALSELFNFFKRNSFLSLIPLVAFISIVLINLYF
ncbi:MAG: glycosyltransferase family 39 protein, partial [Candidatus Levybacteria bacterium]|nr:glycosyltransferase family 39 protein [Candidatus Levybacteria bacterium]